MRSKILDFYPKKGIYSALKYSKIDALHHVVATPILDGYKILREIHATKHIQVYLALDTGSDKEVVLKTPSVNFEDDPVYIDLFVHEEWIGKRIQSPHVMKSVCYFY